MFLVRADKSEREQKTRDLLNRLAFKCRIGKRPDRHHSTEQQRFNVVKFIPREASPSPQSLFPQFPVHPESRAFRNKRQKRKPWFKLPMALSKRLCCRRVRQSQNNLCENSPMSQKRKICYRSRACCNVGRVFGAERWFEDSNRAGPGKGCS